MIMDVDSTQFIFPSAGNTYSSISGHSDTSHWVAFFQSFSVKVNGKRIIHWNLFQLRWLSKSTIELRHEKMDME